MTAASRVSDLSTALDMTATAGRNERPLRIGAPVQALLWSEGPRASD